MQTLFFYFIFVHISLLIVGFAAVSQTRLFDYHSGIKLSLGYLLSIVIFAGLATLSYATKLSPLITQISFWLIVFTALAATIWQKLYLKLWQERFPIACVFVMSLFSLLFITLSYSKSFTYIPDPEVHPGRNYQVFDVKVLNVAQTPANDNYIPYRQAQFFINRSDPAKDSFISEWGVHFFQRTPLMGAVTAQYFNALNDPVPIDYSWSNTTKDVAHTFLKFQVIAQILNALFIVPAFYLIWLLFSRKAAQISLLFIIPSQFFVYNAFFSWPKSLAAFFILFAWLLILKKRFRFLLLAGVSSGLAYLTHDLSVLYIGASVCVLLYQKRFRDTVVFGVISSLFALPWLATSFLYYKKPSSFILYPISTHGIPQPDKKTEIIKEFHRTSILQLLKIRVVSLYYLMSPYQLINSEGGQDTGRRLWALGIYSIPGALGLGLIWPTVIGIFQKFKFVLFWLVVLTPVILSVIVVGWPKGYGALHFAEAVVVLLIGLGSWVLANAKRSIWTLLCYTLSTVQLVFFTLYSFHNPYNVWEHNNADLLRLTIMAGIVILCGVGLYFITKVDSTTNKYRLSKAH